MSLQQNVQQQNDATKGEIRCAADAFRKGEKHIAWLSKYLESQALDPNSGVLARLATTPDQVGDFVQGTWVTAKREFWEFDVLLDRKTWRLIEVEKFENVTGSMTVDSNLKGTGKSFGCLALEVLHEAFKRCSTQARKRAGQRSVRGIYAPPIHTR